MRRPPTKPEDLHYDYSKATPRMAMQFLIDARDYVAQTKVPENRPHVQRPHSDDKKIVGDDIGRPAILDASYIHFGCPLLSISLPDFVSAQEIVTTTPRKITAWDKLKQAFNPQVKIATETHKINTGFNGINLEHAFINLMKYYGIERKEDNKTGLDKVSGTFYIEFDVKDQANYERGRAIIQAYVHGNAETPEQLMQDITCALPQKRISPNAAMTCS